MGTELIANESGTLTAQQVKSQVNLIQEVMRSVMQDGQHYGKVPGCGDKPTLLKPGAEKLSLTFRLRPIIDNDRDISVSDLGLGHREYRVYCHVMNMDGTELATGVGSCSTMESKFRYRGGEKKPTGQAVPKEYWNIKKEGKIQEALERIGGTGYGVAKINGQWEVCELGEKMENPDIADTYNTVLKMAKKRSYVDGILSATAASDIFTQDVEDMADVHPETQSPDPESAKPKVAEPQPKQKEQPVAAETKAPIGISEAKQLDTPAVFTVSGIIQKVVTRVVKGDKSVTDYTIDDGTENNSMKISIWGEADGFAAGGVAAILSDVSITMYKGVKQYMAKGISFPVVE